MHVEKKIECMIHERVKVNMVINIRVRLHRGGYMDK